MHDDTLAFAGIDWASRFHAVCVIRNDGTVAQEFEIGHDAAGLEALVRQLRRSRVGRVAIERPDGPVVESLLETGFEVVVVASRMVKALRTRYSLVGNKSDRSDAYMLADVLRTDGHRLRSLEPDSEQTRALRAAVRTRKELVGHRVALVQQLESHLERVFPGGTRVFADTESAVALKFLRRFPTQLHADWLSEKRLAAWLSANAYCGRKDPAVLFEHLMSAPAGLRGAEAELLGAVTVSLVAAVEAIQAQIGELETRITASLAVHPLAPIFQSLPRSGTVRAAALLVEIGDSKARFPTPESLAALAGVAPSTRDSGQYGAVVHRFVSDKWLKNALCDFAQDSRRANPWAADIYRRARDSRKRHPHAVRILARAWCYVIWRCWQDETPYDPALHRGAQRLLSAAQSSSPGARRLRLVWAR
ncbi:MAG TPA: IS110 family transposase [Acidimicrobiales bacterium]|nr:IS110 family transposase [Acidimicrobiales bacterium]